MCVLSVLSKKENQGKLLRRKMKIKILCVFAFCFLPLHVAHSAFILKIKGRKALVNLEGVQAEKGDTFSALNLYGKALGLLKIKKVKKGKAIAVLLKGKMGPNWILEPRAEEGSRFLASVDDHHESSRSDIYSSPRSSPVKSKINPSSGVGLLTGFHFNFIRLSSAQLIKGRSPRGAFFLDFSFIDGDIVEPGLRVFAGYRQLRVSGGNSCGQSCSLIVHYPGGGFLLRGVFLKREMFQPWIGAGGFLFYPLVDKKHDLGLDKKSFESFHGALTGALGLDLHFKGFYIPLQVDISWINPVLISFQSVKPNSKEFKPFYIGAKLGAAFPF